MKWNVCQIVVELFFLMVFVGCREERVETRSDVSTIVTRAHLPGTLLRDFRGMYWKVVAWPERAIVLPEEMQRMHLNPESAIPLSSIEALCLRNRGLPWRGREGWELVRLANGQFWYVDRMRHLRRGTEEAIMQSWGEGVSSASVWDESMDAWESEYRDLGPMPPADGSLLRTKGTIFYYYDGQAHPFASEELFRAVGYRLSFVVDIPWTSFTAYADSVEPLTVDVFLTCPLAAANARREDDADGDGAIRAFDCDDHDDRRAPHLVETCDRKDNNCDGVVDDGFRVGLPCIVDNGCHTPGITECTTDHLSVECRNDEAVCE